MSSCSSRSSASVASSYFSNVSVSTTDTDFDSHFPQAARASSINLPSRLPAAPAPAPEVDLSALAVDPEYEGLPLGFVVAKLQSLGESRASGRAECAHADSLRPGADLLRNATSTSIAIPAGPQLPPYLSCSLADKLTTLPCSRPSHILAIHAPDSPRTLLMPVHGLLWAAKSPGLSVLSSKPEHQVPSSLIPSTPPPTDSSVPVLELTLPSTRAVPLLQGWIYLASPQLLLASLLPTLPSPPASLSSILNPTPEPTMPAAKAATLSHLPSRALLDSVALVHGLWQNTVALEISDKGLWATMGAAWNVLVGALAIQEQRRLAGARV